MNRIFIKSVLVFGLVAAVTWVQAAEVLNGGFEINFGAREDGNMWGDLGEAWGEAYQVTAGKRDYVRKARTGDRVLLINVPPATWNGAWQQIPWEENAPFELTGYYLIKGGDLPPSCSTFIKAEFYDGNDQMLGMAEGERRREDTKGRWVKESLKGTTPPGTSAVRFILIAGDNAGGEPLVDRIFWDDVDVSD